MLVKWDKEKYSFNIPVVDDQHKELFILLNKLNSLCLDKNSEKSLVVKEAEIVIKDLYNYSSYHFLSEEELFKNYSYPGAEEHVEAHNKFREVIKNYLNDIRVKPNLSLEYLQDFLVEWILNHIQKDDAEYSHYFRENNIQPILKYSEKGSERNNILSMWESRKMSLEIAEIDTQHKALIGILQQTNDLQHTSESRKKTFIPIIIQKLFYYTQYHFSFEEEHMAKNSYPNIAEHRDWHAAFITDINRFFEQYKNGSEDLTDQIIMFLRDWTIEHILKEDKHYKDFLDSEGK